MLASDQEKVNEILDNESRLLETPNTQEGKIKQYLIESGIINYYINPDAFIKSFLELSRNKSTENNENWNTLNTIEKVYSVFIESHDVSDYEFGRLRNQPARNYYHNYVMNLRKESFNERVTSHFKYFKEKSKDVNVQNRMLYVSQTYGEVSFENVSDGVFTNYVNLGEKSNEEIVNLAIVKLKMEDDFLSFKLNRFVVMLFDFDLITKEEYHLFIYGTTDETKIALTRSGLTISLISKLESDNQLDNIGFDEFNNLSANDTFKQYLTTINDLNRYEMEKYIN